MPRFFSPDSYWNRPIAPDDEVDPRSDVCMRVLAGPDGGPLFINLRQWTVPVYEVTPDTPRRTIHQRPLDERHLSRPCRWGQWTDRRKWFSHGPGFGQNVPVPLEAAHDPFGDAHMAMVDWATRTAWDVWACRIRPDGEYESFTGMKYSLDGTGVWRTEDFPVRDGESIHFHGPSRAAGVPAIAGLIMLDEVLSGHIAHKVAFASYYNAWKEFVYPAAWTDGFRKVGVPEGAVLQLDPSLNLGRFGLSPAAHVIARALQEYGMVNVDNAGGSVVYAEGFYGPSGKTWQGILDPEDLKKIPIECYRMLRLGEVTHLGDHPNGPRD